MNPVGKKEGLFRAGQPVLGVKGGDVLLPANQLGAVEFPVSWVKKADGALPGAGAGSQADGGGGEALRDGEGVFAFHGIAFFVVRVGFSVAQMGRLGNRLGEFEGTDGTFLPQGRRAGWFFLGLFLVCRFVNDVLHIRKAR